MYNYIFIRNVLDFILNHIFGIYSFIVLKNCLVIESCLVVNFLMISLFFSIADYYDLKFGIIPNKLSLGLLAYGIAFNLSLALLFNDLSILFFSILLTVLVGSVAFVLWLIGFWGGGDFKIFIGLSLGLSFLDFNTLNRNDFSYFALNRSINDLNLPMSNQFIFYPKVFSIIFNGILIAFIFLSLILINDILKNKQLKYYSLLSILDFKSFFNQLTTKTIHIDDLSEGMVLGRYYLSNKKIFEGIDNIENTNLHIRQEGDDYYLTSSNRIGLTEYDVEFIRELYKKDMIKNPDFQIKKGIPFMPFLTLGYVCFLIFGDFISIISGFFKVLF